MAIGIETITVLALLAAAYFFARILPQWLAGVPQVSPIKAQEIIAETPDMLILDLRVESQFEGVDGHLAGARNIPLMDLITRFKAFRESLADHKEKRILLTCPKGRLSLRAASKLRRGGFKRVAVLKGGLMAWKKAGLPLSHGAGEPAESTPGAAPDPAARRAEAAGETP